MPHVIELFVATHCPGSPDARMRLQEFAASRHDIVIVERNIEDHFDEARRYGLFATPAIVLDGSTVLYGVPTSAQLAARCARLRAPTEV
jgi:glutaredoxin-related protein